MALAGLWMAKPGAPARPQILTAALDQETARELGQMEQALRPEHVEDWLRLADTCRAFNLLAEAARCYGEIDRLTPTKTEHLFGWAVTLSRMGETQQARGIFERALARGIPEADACRLMLARDYLREENPAAAEKILREIKDSPDATVYLARVLIRTGRAAEAIPALERWLAQNPDDLHARQMRAWAAAELGNADEARLHRLIALRCRAEMQHQDLAAARDELVRRQFGRGQLLAGTKRGMLLRTG